jgi:hypothetical protein
MMLIGSARASRISASGDRQRLGDALDEVATLDLHRDRLVRAGNALPISSLICSAVRSPMSRLYFFLMDWMIARPSRCPATRTDFEYTMPASEMTAMSVGAAADVDDHVAGGLGDGQPGADGGGHGLVDEVDLGSLGLRGRVLDRRFSTCVTSRGCR